MQHNQSAKIEAPANQVTESKAMFRTPTASEVTSVGGQRIDGGLSTTRLERQGIVAFCFAS